MSKIRKENKEGEIDRNELKKYIFTEHWKRKDVGIESIPHAGVSQH